MPDCMVLFDPLDHTEESFVPPAGVEGGIVGDTENGIMAVYDVPVEHMEQFEAMVAECSTAVKMEWLEQERTR